MNDNPPKFLQSSYHFRIREDLALPGYMVTDQLNVQDKDSNVSIVVSLTVQVNTDIKINAFET